MSSNHLGAWAFQKKFRRVGLSKCINELTAVFVWSHPISTCPISPSLHLTGLWPASRFLFCLARALVVRFYANSSELSYTSGGVGEWC